MRFSSPLLMAAWTIDAFSNPGTAIQASLFNGIDLTGADTLKVITAVFLSIAFTYAHGSKPNPGRAAGLFTGGMALSGLALKSGLPIAMLSHGVHNLRSLLGLSTAEEMVTSKKSILIKNFS